MPDFVGTDTVVIQPYDDDVPYSWGFEACSSAIANDGSLPFGTTISSYTITAHKHGSPDVDASDALIASHGRNGFVIQARLQYPTTLGAGMYHIRIVLTLSDTSDIEFDFNRVVVRDK